LKIQEGREINQGNEERAPMLKITVLMPVYNNENTVAEAVESVLGQSFHDFELLVIDDGSNDRTPELLSRYCDSRLRVIRNVRNLKIVQSLNRGLDEARGDYIARMDGDDICLKERFALQKAYLDKHPDVGVVGSWIEMFGACAAHIHKSPEAHDDIVALSCFCNPMAHPSVMLRRSTLGKDRYSEDYPYAEDWELWRRLSKRTRLANIPKVLVRYRVASPTQGVFRPPEGKRKILKENVMSLGLDVSHVETLLATVDHNIPDIGALKTVEPCLQSVYERNRHLELYPKKSFNKEIGRHWFLCSRMVWSVDPSAWKIFLNSPLCLLVGYSKSYILYLRVKETTALGLFFKKVVGKIRALLCPNPLTKKA